MVNYLASKIYTVRCRNDNSLIYVGSTTCKLTDRFSQHKNGTNLTTLNRYIKDNCNGDWSNWYIELHEEFSCRNKEELLKREGEVIREIATINKNIAGRTKKEWYLDNSDKVSKQHKEYYTNNTDKISKQHKEYYTNNTDKILEQKKQYYNENTDKIADYKKKYYNDNLGKFREKARQYYIKNREAIIKRQIEYNKNKKKTDISVN